VLQSFDLSLAPAYGVALVVGYLCGSIPFGLILTRLAGTQDIRSIGSGKGLTAATLLGDTLKGTAAVLLVYWYYGRGLEYFARELALPAALGAFLGATLFPVSPGFKGDKGLATYIGVLLALAWPAAIAFCLIWLAVAALTRYASLAGLIASAATPFILWGLDQLPEAKLFALLTVLLWIMHGASISRLIAGTEAKIGKPAGSG
jgi:acyl phosphate:glycerol-3-phosphate acyltransferase